MRADTDDSSKKILQEMKVLHEMISTLMTKMSNLSYQQNSNVENLLSKTDKSNMLLSNFKFNKSNALFFFSKSVVS
jgi:hypothetical protein